MKPQSTSKKLRFGVSKKVITSVYVALHIIIMTFVQPALASPKIDPIRFSLSTRASQVGIGDEFEIQIKAQYLSIPTGTAFVFEGTNSFRIKLLMPDGFEQTGGSYRDFLNGELTASNPTITYLVKGRFTRSSNDRSFRLLRGHKKASEESKLIQVATLSFLVNEGQGQGQEEEIQIISEEVESTARLMADSLNSVMYMSIADLRSGKAGNCQVVYCIDNNKAGIFRYRASSTAADDSAMVIVAGNRRYFRDYEYIRPEYFGAKGDGVTDDAAAINRAIAYTKKGDVKFKSGTYVIGSPIILSRGTRLLGEGAEDTSPGRGTEILLANNANCSMLQTQLAAGTGVATHYMAIENIVFDGNAGSQSDANIGINFKGAYVTSYLKNVMIVNNRGTALSLSNGLDVELHHIWVVNSLITDASRYAVEINRDGVDNQDGLVHFTHMYIENTKNKASGDPRNVVNDRGNGLLVRKTATFFMTDVHFEGMNTCINLDDNHVVNIGKISTAHCGVPSETDNAMIRLPSASPSVTIESTESYNTNYSFILKKVNGFTSNEIPDVPFYPYSHGIRFNDDLSRAPYLLPRTTVANTLTIGRVGTTSPQQLRINNDLQGSSSGFFKSNGRFLDFGTNFGNPSDRTVLRLDVPGTGTARSTFFSKVSFSDRVILGEATGPMDEFNSFAIVSGITGLGKGPAYQRKLNGVAGLNYLSSVRTTYTNPDSSASYIGEFLFNRATKKYWVSISSGSGAADWQLMSHGPGIVNYGTFDKQIRVKNDTTAASTGAFFKSNGRYIDIGSNYANSGSDKVVLRLDVPNSTTTQAFLYGKVNLNAPLVLGEKSGPMDADKSIGIVSGISGTGKGPAYQRKANSIAGTSFFTTVRSGTANPDSGATYLGEFYFNKTTKKYLVSTSVGLGANDWQQMNNGAGVASYGTFDKVIRIKNDTTANSTSAFIKSTGRYIDIGSNHANSGTDKVVLRLDVPNSTTTQATVYGKVVLNSPITLGEKVGPMDADRSLAVVSGIGNLGKGPAYQRVANSTSGTNFITTVRTSASDPGSSASYLGEFYFNTTTKKYFVSVSVGTGVTDWQLMNHTSVTPIKKSATLNFPSVAPGASADLTISAGGAAINDFVTLGPPSLPVGYAYTAWVSQTNVVTVRLTNNTTAAIDPGSANYRIMVTK